MYQKIKLYGMGNWIRVFLIIVVVCQSGFSQVTLKASLNGMRAGDKIVKQQVDYVSSDARGEGLVWDFSRLNIINENYMLAYYRELKNDTSQISGWEHGTRYFYKQVRDSVLMTAYRNRSVNMQFEAPEIQMIFPFHYGDTVKCKFKGRGACFADISIPSEGETIITADALGLLITPSRDTLNNVLCVKRLRKYNEIGVDSVKMVLETNQWYAAGYRYPIFETIKSIVLKGDSAVDDFSTAFYFPLAGIESLADDPMNETIREHMKKDCGILTSCLIIPNPVDNHCSLSFELSSQAIVSVYLCDMMGNPISVVMPRADMSSGIHQRDIDVSSLRRGNYVILVQANNYFIRRIMIKK